MGETREMLHIEMEQQMAHVKRNMRLAAMDYAAALRDLDLKEYNVKAEHRDEIAKLHYQRDRSRAKLRIHRDQALIDAGTPEERDEIRLNFSVKLEELQNMYAEREQRQQLKLQNRMREILRERREYQQSARTIHADLEDKKQSIYREYMTKIEKLNNQENNEQE